MNVLSIVAAMTCAGFRSVVRVFTRVAQSTKAVGRSTESPRASHDDDIEVFTDALIMGLKRDADPYHNRIVTTRALYVWLLGAVFKEAQKVNRDLTPLFVDLNPKGSDGDFIFVQ